MSGKTRRIRAGLQAPRDRAFTICPTRGENSEEKVTSTLSGGPMEDGLFRRGRAVPCPAHLAKKRGRLPKPLPCQVRATSARAA